MKTHLEVDCFEVDMEKLGIALDVTHRMPHKRLEAAQDVLEELIKALTIESKKEWEDYKSQNTPTYYKGEDIANATPPSNLKEPIIVFECQACFTKFTRDDQNSDEQQNGLCPSCWHHDLKIIKLTTRSEQDRINAVLEA